MMAALRAEYRKLISTRMWWILLLVMAVYLAFIGGAMAAAFSFTDDMGIMDGRTTAVMVYSVINAIAYVFPLIIGSLAVTTEFRHQTITATLLARPNRGQLIMAKLASSVPIGLMYGVAATAAVVAVAAPMLAGFGDGAYLGDPEVQQTLLFTVLTMAAWTVIGVAFGCVVNHQVAAIVTLIVFTQFIEPLVRTITMAVDSLSGISRFFPGAAADAIVGSSFFSSMGDGGGQLLTRWQGGLVLAVYAAVFVLLGRLTTFRRDIG